jgi:endonuclease/exonuclease/phosphatase family metal-dependent hydrolase
LIAVTKIGRDRLAISHRVSLVSKAFIVVAIPLAVATGCAMKHEMEPLAANRACPGRESAGAVIGWYGPDKEKDIETLDRWCQTVGPPAIDSTAAAHRAAWSPGDSIVVATWNTHGGAGDLLGFIEAELDLSCDEGKPSPGADYAPFVLLIQEAFRRSDIVPRAEPGPAIRPKLKEKPRPGDRIDIVHIARHCGLSLFYVPSMRNGIDEYDSGREDRGNAILSTLRLSDFIAIELPFEAQRRVAVAATVHTTDGDSLRVVSAHFDVASSLLRLLSTGNSTRERQGAGLLDALAEVELMRAGLSDTSATARCYPWCDDSSTPRFFISTLVGGDFNTWSANETVIKHFYRAFPQSPPRDGKPTRSSFPADYIFFRQAQSRQIVLLEESHRRIEDLHHSDHHARLVRLSPQR